MIIKKTQLENKKQNIKNRLTTNEPESEIISELFKRKKREKRSYTKTGTERERERERERKN